MLSVEEQCLNESLDHKWVFLQAKEGATQFICGLCGAFTQEFEDSNP